MIEQRFVRLSGESRNVEVVGVPVQFEGKAAVQVLIRDITERKRAEADLQRVVELFRLIEDNMRDAICVLDLEGEIYYSSPSHHQLLGRDPYARSAGKLISENVHPDDLPRAQHAFRQQTPFRTELRVRHGNGSWITIELSGMPVKDRHYDVPRIVLVLRDITERKTSEELIRRSDKLAAVGELAAGIAHEIRNPLAAVKGFLQLLLPEASSKQKECLDIIYSETNRIDLITNQLLVLAKPHDVTFIPSQLDDILEEVTTLLATRAILNNVEIVREAEQRRHLVQCDPNQIKQVFVNVIKNAIEAMPHGGRAFLKVRTYDTMVHVECSDEGNGIPQELVPNIGQPFYTTKENGTGLGLLVSFRIVENHGGMMSISSEVGRGTTVTVVLPELVSTSEA